MSIKQHLQDAAVEFSRALAVGALIGAMLMIIYLAFEPVISRSQAVGTFEVTQEITGEISFATPAADVTMDPPIASLTGGTSTGATQVVVSTNSITGYNMTIAFSSSTAMNQRTGTSSIPNYTPATPGTPDFTFSNVPLNSAEFGYTVEATTTLDIDDTFEDNGASDCSGSGTFTADSCWMNPSTTAQQIINRTTIAPNSGATSTIKFQLVVNPNPNPGIPADFYTATATLTATNQ
jgi:hypothetical protein